MSGLEILVIVGVGAYIYKQRQKKKQQRELIAAGSAPEQNTPTGIAASVRGSSNQQGHHRGEEPLPSYSPPTNALLNERSEKVSYLPTYDETVQQQRDLNRTGNASERDRVVIQRGSDFIDGSSTTASSEAPVAKQRKWKLWTRDSTSKA